MKENYASVYDVKLDQIKALNGDGDKNKYDSVYQAELEMLRLLEEGGHSGGGTTPEEVREIVESYDYTTMAEVEDKGYLTEHQQLKTINNQSIIGTGNIEIGGETSGITEAECRSIVEGYDYATKSEIPSLDGYATENWVENQGYLTEHQDISKLITASNFDIPEGISPTLNKSGLAMSSASGKIYPLNLSYELTKTASDGGGWIGIASLRNYVAGYNAEQGYLTEIPAIYAKVVMLTQAEYDALATKDDHTLYIITDQD